MSSQREDEIFSAVENGTYRFALQQCQKLIKKSPKTTYYKVLHNYVLLESGKDEEALQNCLEIMSHTPNDIKSLLLLNKIFNSLHRPKEAQLVYENAAKKYPSFEILTNWFHLGCEMGDYRVLQKSSIALKNFQNSQRLFHLWAAFNSYLGAINEDVSPMERKLFPRLGLKIIEDLKPLKTEQEVYVLVKLLKLNSQLEEIHDAIWEFTGKDKLDLELQIVLLETLNELQDWEKLLKYCELVLIEYKLDDFNTWKYLIKSALELEKKDKALDVIQDYNGTRNAQLALIELHLQSCGSIEDSVFEYLTKMGTKNCAFIDIKPYIPYIDSKKLLEWLENHTIHEGEKGLYWTINVVKFKLFINGSALLLAPEFIKENVDNYNAYKPLLSKKIKTDFFAGNEFLFFILSSLLCDNFSPKSIVTSIIILENAVLKDQHEFHLRLWLIQLYTLVNCHTQARVHYDSLNIRYVQNDIFNHYLISRVASLLPNYNDFLKESLDIYEKIDTETIYFNKVGYNKASFNKLQGIVEFQNKVSRSALKDHVVLQGLKIGRLLNDNSIRSIYEKAQNNLLLNQQQFDNRDFKIFWNIGINEVLAFKKDILENIPENMMEYNKIQHFLEALIAGSSNTNADFDLSTLSDAENWSFATILETVKFLNGKSTDFARLADLYNSIPDIPAMLDWKLSHNTITIIDTTKCVQSLISSAFKSSNSFDKSKANELKEMNLQLLQKIREDLILSKRTEINKFIDSLHQEVKQEQLLRDLEIQESTINRIFEIIRYSNNEAFKQLRVL